LIRTSARGTLMGNRGVLHDERQQIRRLYRGRAWITCLLAFKGRDRDIMQPGRYTELFFLDEATAFAAGHRPCWECRRQRAIAFKAAWLAGNSDLGFDAAMTARQLDEVLHAERITSGGEKVVHRERMDVLPDGTFVRWSCGIHLVLGERLLAWSPEGYAGETPRPRDAEVDVLTPRSVVRAFGAGHSPDIHLR